LPALRKAEAACRRCPLYRDATQVVPGEGPARATFMFVGEQPGNQEDRAGKPFVGPAGRLFDRALDDAGIPRNDVFVTNAVKHFKHEMRGKKRLHKRPNAYEIDRCNWWLGLERKIIRPQTVVALGATAARALIGKAVTITATRGRVLKMDDGTVLIVTVHPSSLLRSRGDPEWEGKYRAFVKDLKFAAYQAAKQHAA
jgi:DNA polymerase